MLRIQMPIEVDMRIDPTRHHCHAGQIVIGLPAARPDRYDSAPFYDDPLVTKHRPGAIDKSPGLNGNAILRQTRAGQPRVRNPRDAKNPHL